MEVKICVFYMLFTFFIYLFFIFKGDLVSYFFLFQNICFSDNAPLMNNIFIKNIIENIPQFLISINLLFSLQKYCLDFTPDFTKIQTYFYDVLIILLYSKYDRNHE